MEDKDGDRKNISEEGHHVVEEIEEKSEKAVEVLTEVNDQRARTCQLDEQFENLRLENKRNVTPKRNVCKENLKPRVISQTEVKKDPIKQSIVPRPKLSLRQPATEVKKARPMMRNSSRPAVTSPSVTRTKPGPSAAPAPVSAAKTLQFTPKGSSLKPARREPSGQFKQPSQAVESKLKKLIPASRGGGGGRLASNNLLKPPRPAGPLKSLPSAALNKSSTQCQSSGLARSGLARPALYRSGLLMVRTVQLSVFVLQEVPSPSQCCQPRTRPLPDGPVISE